MKKICLESVLTAALINTAIFKDQKRMLSQFKTLKSEGYVVDYYDSMNKKNLVTIIMSDKNGCSKTITGRSRFPYP